MPFEPDKPRYALRCVNVDCPRNHQDIKVAEVPLKVVLCPGCGLAMPLFGIHERLRKVA